MSKQLMVPAPMQNAIAELQIDTTKCELMVPTESFGRHLGKFERLTLEVIHIHNNDVDTYPLPGGKKGLSKVALLRISHAMGIVWDPNRTGIVESTHDLARARATAAMRMPNGETIVLSDEKEIDMETAEEEIRAGAEGKSKSEAQIRKDILQKRKFKNELAMTGAKLRCIRQLVAIPAAVPPTMLDRPWVFPRITIDTDKMAADPAMREATLRRMDDTARAVFGAPVQDIDATPVLAVEGALALEQDVAGSLGDFPADEASAPEAAEEPEQAAAPSEIQTLIAYLDAHKTDERLSAQQRDYVRQMLDAPEAAGIERIRVVEAKVREKVGG